MAKEVSVTKALRTMFQVISATAVKLAALDLRSLAFFRIGLGLLLIGDLFWRYGDLRAHYTDEGIIPVSLYANTDLFSIHLLHGSPGFQRGLFLIAGLLAVAVLIGYRTRLAVILSWVMLISLQARNPTVLQGGDILQRLLVFWSMFLPLGARWSIDASRKPVADVPIKVASFPTTAFLLQVCFVYWFAVTLKSHAIWRSEFTAVYYALQLDGFVTPLGAWLRQFGDLLKAMTIATLGLEALGPVLLWVPIYTGFFRFSAVIVMLGFHLFGLGLTMELGPFPYICAVAWVPFLPTGFWDRLEACRLPQRWRAGDPASTAEPSSLNPLHADAPNPRRETTRLTFHAADLLVIPAILYVFLWNLRTTEFHRYRRYLPPSANAVGFLFGLDQMWSMFAPNPMKNDGWFVIVGHLKNKSQVDLFKEGAPVTWDKPARVADMYKNERWRKFMMNLWDRNFSQFRPHYARWLCQEWNREHSGKQALEKLQIYYMLERTLPNYEPSKVEKVMILEYVSP